MTENGIPLLAGFQIGEIPLERLRCICCFIVCPDYWALSLPGWSTRAPGQKAFCPGALVIFSASTPHTWQFQMVFKRIPALVAEFGIRIQHLCTFAGISRFLHALRPKTQNVAHRQNIALSLLVRD